LPRPAPPATDAAGRARDVSATVEIHRPNARAVVSCGPRAVIATRACSPPREFGSGLPARSFGERPPAGSRLACPHDPPTPPTMVPRTAWLGGRRRSGSRSPDQPSRRREPHADGGRDREPSGRLGVRVEGLAAPHRGRRRRDRVRVRGGRRAGRPRSEKRLAPNSPWSMPRQWSSPIRGEISKCVCAWQRSSFPAGTCAFLCRQVLRRWIADGSQKYAPKVGPGREKLTRVASSWQRSIPPVFLSAPFAKAPTMRLLLKLQCSQANRRVTVHTRNDRDRESTERLGYGVFRKSYYQVRRFALISSGSPRSKLAAHRDLLHPTSLNQYITRERLHQR